MKGVNVLVVDDEPDVRDLLQTMLSRAGHDVILAVDGREAIALTEERQPDVVLLDITMPLIDGWQTLERIRAFSGVPVLMLTARDTEMDKVRGLKGGADDYVTKPFGRQELLARIEALMRRVGPVEEQEKVYDDGCVRIDFVQAQVTVDGRPVSLTKLEFKLLAAFVHHPDELLSQERLLETVWGTTFGSRDQVKLYVGYLRRKMGWGGDDGPIETVRGFGYRYHPPTP